jgi:hypothetical protein
MIANVKTDRKSVTSDEIGSLHSFPLSQGWTEAKTSALDWVALFRLPPIRSRIALRIRLWRLPARPFHYKPPTNSTWLAGSEEGSLELPVSTSLDESTSIEASPLSSLASNFKARMSLCAALVLLYCSHNIILQPMTC